MTRSQFDVRWDVPTPEALRGLTTEALPLGLQAGEPRRAFHRDLYFDTADGALRQRGAACRLRLRSDGRQELMVSMLEDAAGRIDFTRTAADVEAARPEEVLAGASEPARVLRSLVNPGALSAELELEVERHVRETTAGWLRRPRFRLTYDVVTVRAAGLARTFQELGVGELRGGRPSLDDLARAVGERYALRAVNVDKLVRGSQIRAALESEALARGVGAGRWVAVVALDGARVACFTEGEVPRLPVSEGSGEDACRHLMRRVLGSAAGDLHLLSTVLGEGRLRCLEVWVANRVDRSGRSAVEGPVAWVPLGDLLARAASAEIQDAPTLAALTTVSRSALFPRLAAAAQEDARAEVSPTITAELRAALPGGPGRATALGGGPLLDPDQSLLAFNTRVLELAEDASVPLLERLRYLSIVSGNLDEFFMVRAGRLKLEGPESAAEDDGDAAGGDRAAAVARAARALVARQYACLEACRPALAAHGIRVRAPGELDSAGREYLKTYFRSTVFPYLTPRAITNTPGHSLPVIPDRLLCFAVLLRDANAGGPLHVAELTIPAALPRFVKLPGGDEFVAIEDVIRPELAMAYPGRRVEHASLFRVTRDGGLDGDERRAGNLAQAMEEWTESRRHRPVVRVEVERAMPATLRELLLRELQLEPGAPPGALGPADMYEIGGLMDLGALKELANVSQPALKFAPFEPNWPLPPAESLWETLRERDVLVHHPYEDFRGTVGRFFEEAADDPDVAAIKVTLYRSGERSPIVDALLRAAAAGKDVSVFVELKARFDEQQNVRWAKRMEAAGIHVVHGVLGVKNHAKAALVVRSENGVPRRYAHVGTGNYNATTAQFYTDLGVLTARESLCADVHDLFNALTGSSVPTVHAYRECLVAPSGLLPGLLSRIEREAAHARAGRAGRIRMKLNGLSDREAIDALYRASQAGVTVDLVVRGICTLAPGVPGLSERIRVVSLLGRFLEHARVVAFDNGGEPEYFIGSADLRPRNLRRRVELLAPMHDPAVRARLDALLQMELADPTAFDLRADGSYVRRRAAPDAPRRSSQGDLMAMAADARAAAAVG